MEETSTICDCDKDAHISFVAGHVVPCEPSLFFCVQRTTYSAVSAVSGFLSPSNQTKKKIGSDVAERRDVEKRSGMRGVTKEEEAKCQNHSRNQKAVSFTLLDSAYQKSKLKR